MTENTNSKLPLLKLIFGAAIFAYEKRFVLARSLWLPFVIGMSLPFADSFGVDVGGDLGVTEEGGELNPNAKSFGLMYFVVIAMFFITIIASVRAYRVLLECDLAERSPISWGLSETKFTLAMFSLGMIFMFVLAISSTILVSIFNVFGDVGFFAMLNFLPPIYIAARLILVFPEVSRNPDIGVFEALKWSWLVTKGNGLVLMLLAVIFPLAIALGINWFSSTGLPLAEFIGAALVWLVLPFEVALIALSYSTIQKIQSIAVDAPEDTND